MSDRFAPGYQMYGVHVRVMYMELMDLAVRVLFICSFAELPHQINLWSLYLESGESHCADKLVKSRFPANAAFNMQLKICTELTL